jgi:hypothetical protein
MDADRLDYDLAARSLMAPENKEWRDMYFKMDDTLLKAFSNTGTEPANGDGGKQIRIPMFYGRCE